MEPVYAYAHQGEGNQPLPKVATDWARDSGSRWIPGRESRHDTVLNAPHGTRRILRADADERALLAVVPLPMEAPRQVTLVATARSALSRSAIEIGFGIQDDHHNHCSLYRSRLEVRHRDHRANASR